MRVYTIKGKDHYVYEDDSEIPKGVDIEDDWKEAEIGDWVRASDGNVIQILRKGVLNHSIDKKGYIYLGTCTGTFIPRYQEMDTDPREDRYSIGGKQTAMRTKNKANLTSWEEQFVHLVAGGLPPVEAYLRVYPTNKRPYASVQSSALMKTERVRKAMKKELEPVLKELGIDEKFILDNIKHIAELGDREEAKLKALFKLADIMDLEDKTSTKTQVITGTVFKGFGDDLLEVAHRPKEITSGE